ncbi:unnamed protein product [Paramecium sonneborni]|uniref:Uncharacterized protein n=1 Tax=Paramecium sonneborni TaxID=65129 RepID=A0A8S1RSS1_9CILI|nr:unnamed protein product [Paramecium sonneborni]
MDHPKNFHFVIVYYGHQCIQTLNQKLFSICLVIQGKFIRNSCPILTQGISGSGKAVASKGILDYIEADSKSGLYISNRLNKRGKQVVRKIITTLFEGTSLTKICQEQSNDFVYDTVNWLRKSKQTWNKNSSYWEHKINYFLVRMIKINLRRIKNNLKKIFINYYTLTILWLSGILFGRDSKHIFAGPIYLKEDSYQKAQELLKILNQNEKKNSNITQAGQSRQNPLLMKLL